MRYLFTAVFEPQADGSFFARIPDLPGCITSGKNLDDAIVQITDAASIWLVDAEDDNEPIPKSHNQEDLTHNESDVLSIIQIDTLAYRASIDTRAVRKNVSIPAWMANLADKRNINVSQVLQDALLKALQ